MGRCNLDASVDHQNRPGDLLASYMAPARKVRIRLRPITQYL